MKENNFKQTEIGLIPDDWEVVRLREVADVKAGQSAPQGEKYFKNGKHPFIRVQHIDNEDYRITNWDLINDAAVKDYRLKLFPKGTIIFPKSGAAVYLEKRAMLPFDSYIVSHLCAINSKNDKLLQKFLFYFLINKKLAKKKAAGYPTLNLSEIKELNIPLPPVEEQRKIARVLDKIQQAIEIQDRIIEQAKRLKKSLMQKLFTEGLYGEEQKETEIGLIPKSWEVVRLGEIGIFEYGYTETALEENTGIKFLRITDIKDDGLILWNEVPYCKISETKLKKYQLKNGDILFARIGATTGKTCFIESPPKSVFASYLIRLKIKTDVYKKFVYYYTQTPIYWSQVEANREGKLKKGISATLLRTFKIPLPPLEEQKQIVHILSTIDRKIEVEQRRKQVLKELFKTMLHKLMSGEIRLKEMEI